MKTKDIIKTKIVTMFPWCKMIRINNNKEVEVEETFLSSKIKTKMNKTLLNNLLNKINIQKINNNNSSKINIKYKKWMINSIRNNNNNQLNIKCRKKWLSSNHTNMVENYNKWEIKINSNNRFNNNCSKSFFINHLSLKITINFNNNNKM